LNSGRRESQGSRLFLSVVDASAKLERKPMTLDELKRLTLADRGNRHIFGEPASQEKLIAWQGRWKDHPLPQDLLTHLREVDGIHLGADPETGRAYEGLAPLSEWDLACKVMWEPEAEPEMLGDPYFARRP
jgi:hypothetical protein